MDGGVKSAITNIQKRLFSSSHDFVLNYVEVVRLLISFALGELFQCHTKISYSMRHHTGISEKDSTIQDIGEYRS